MLPELLASRSAKIQGMLAPYKNTAREGATSARSGRYADRRVGARARHLVPPQTTTRHNAPQHATTQTVKTNPGLISHNPKSSYKIQQF